MSENNKKLDVSQLADLSVLDTSKSAPVSPEKKPEAQPEVEGKFFDHLAGVIASIGLPDEQRLKRGKEYEELAEWLGMGKYYAKALGGTTDLPPTQGAIIMTILFAVIVILGRDDVRRMVAGMIVRKPVDKRQELRQKAEEKGKISEGEYKKPESIIEEK